MLTTTISKTTFFATVLLLTHCGGANFTGSGGKEAPKGKEVRNSGGADGSAALTWLWPCGETNSKPKAENGGITISGPGPHEVTKANLEGKSLVVKGNACNITASRRNVVFVIDVSGSMRTGSTFGSPGNDPLANGSCGRMEAVREVISTIQAKGNARFAVATFEDSIVDVSTELFSSEQDLYDDLLAVSGQSQLQNVLCRGNGGTNYNAGLQSAEALLANLQGENELSEVYFVSDGQPNTGDEGSALAQQLKDNGTLIATVMVGNDDDTILKSQIASLDDRNAPYHSRVDSSSELAKVLARLADNQVSEGLLSYYNNDSTDELGKFDFTAKFAGTSFAFEAFKLDLKEVPTGIALEIKIKDRFGHEELKSGELVWASD